MARWPNGYRVRLSRQRSQVRNLEATFFIFYFSSPYVGRREKSIRRRFFAPLRVAKAVKKGPLVFTPFSIPLAASWSIVPVQFLQNDHQVYLRRHFFERQESRFNFWSGAWGVIRSP